MFKKKTLIFILLFLMILPAVWSLFKPGFFVSDDGEWMVIRLTDFHRSVVAGQIPVRWAARLNYSYGYPVFNFLYPLSFYMGEVFHLLGFSFVNAIKLVFIFSFFLSGFLMYLFGRELWGKWGGLVAAIFYVYAPYRFLAVYVRGSIGEAVSFVFIPLIFLAFNKLSQVKDRLWLVLGTLGIAGLIMSHNIMAMLFLPIALFYAGWLIWLSQTKKRLAGDFGMLILLGLGLSCFFWLPALYDKQFTILDQVRVANYWEHFPSLKQLLIPSWGYGPSVTGTTDQASYQIGLVHLLAIGLALFALRTKKALSRNQILFFLIVFLTAIFLMLPLSTFVWQTVPFLWRTQFPWRILALSAFSSSVLSGAVVKNLKAKQEIKAAILLLVLVILANFSYAKPVSFVNRPESFYTTNEATTTVKDEYLPIWVQEKPLKRAEEKVEILAGEGKIEALFSNSKKTTFKLEAETETEVQVNTIYFPGWQARVNSQLMPIDFQNEKGLIRLKIPSGDHQILVVFKETPLRLSADIISLFSLLALGGLLVKAKKDET